jgi:hypothetical protein
MLKLCAALFRFHLAEYRLLQAVRHGSPKAVIQETDSAEVQFHFDLCIQAALSVGSVFQTDIVPHEFLPYCFTMGWSALAITCVWLVRVCRASGCPASLR